MIAVHLMSFAYFLYFLVAFNAVKLPYYLGDPSKIEASPHITTLTGGRYRGSQMWSDPILFLFVHTLLGCIVVGLWAHSILNPIEMYMSSGASTIFFVIAIIFAVHIWPERAGVPNRLFGKGINEAACGVVILGALLGLGGILGGNAGIVKGGYETVGIASILAPCLEFVSILASCARAKDNDWVFLSPDGETPIFNKDGYYRFRPLGPLKCPWANTVSGSQATNTASV